MEQKIERNHLVYFFHPLMSACKSKIPALKIGSILELRTFIICINILSMQAKP